MNWLPLILIICAHVQEGCLVTFHLPSLFQLHKDHAYLLTSLSWIPYWIPNASAFLWSTLENSTPRPLNILLSEVIHGIFHLFTLTSVTNYVEFLKSNRGYLSNHLSTKWVFAVCQHLCWSQGIHSAVVPVFYLWIPSMAGELDKSTAVVLHACIVCSVLWRFRKEAFLSPIAVGRWYFSVEVMFKVGLKAIFLGKVFRAERKVTNESRIQGCHFQERTSVILCLGLWFLNNWEVECISESPAFHMWFWSIDWESGLGNLFFSPTPYLMLMMVLPKVLDLECRM